MGLNREKVDALIKRWEGMSVSEQSRLIARSCVGLGRVPKPIATWTWPEGTNERFYGKAYLLQFEGEEDNAICNGIDEYDHLVLANGDSVWEISAEQVASGEAVLVPLVPLEEAE